MAYFLPSPPQLGITTLTPEGLLLGAKSIVFHNKQLKKEMVDLERELLNLKGQSKVIVCTD